LGGGRVKGQIDLVKQVIAKLGKRLNDDEDLKGSISDLVRLIQLEKEMEEEMEVPHEIKVRWVENQEALLKGR
jgi:hypothetical protein